MAKDEKSLQGKPASDDFLIVVEGFNDYRRGDSIRDKEEIKKVLASPQASHVHLIKGKIND